MVVMIKMKRRRVVEGQLALRQISVGMFMFLRLVLLMLFMTSSLLCQRSAMASTTNTGWWWWPGTNEADGQSRWPPTNMSPKLNELLNRIGPNMRASADYHDFTDIQLNESIEAWHVLHEQTKLFAQDQVKSHRPKLMQLLASANASQACVHSINQTLDAMERLDSWAIQVWSSTGNLPPTGLFDGQFTDLGSYHGCIDAKPKLTTNTNSSHDINHTSFCVLAFRPIVPSRAPFHAIFQKEQSDLVNLFDKSDAFHEVLQFAQYFHYVYLKTGLCVPYQCNPLDIQQVAGVIGRRLALMSGPVKCFTKATTSSSLWQDYRDEEYEEFEKIENKPILVEINKRMNLKQFVAFLIVAAFFGTVFLATLWHAAEIWLHSSVRFQDNVEDIDEAQDDYHPNGDAANGQDKQYKEQNGHQQDGRSKGISVLVIDDKSLQESSGLKYVAFHYFSMITNGKDFINTSMRSKEIKCLHGWRAFTMIWIICVHTLQYNEWSGFTRIFENVNSLQNPVLHPLLNANYVVDNFFLMSGLLAAYTLYNSSNFSIISSLIGRYLRLTPQVLLISLLYILLPLTGGGPFWYDMTHYPSKYCEKNWWVNMLHLQAFYRDGEMCNLVSWWISVDMFYYIIALMFLWLIFRNKTRSALMATSIYVGYCLAVTGYRHYTGGYTPNNLGTVPQINEVWTKFVVHFVWSPYPHAFPFFLGLWVGYILANDLWKKQVRSWSRLGWYLATSSLLIVNLSSHIWMSGAVQLGPQSISTFYNIICSIIWSISFAWLIIACHYGCAPKFNKIMSLKLFVMLSKASFIIYLSHMLVVRMVYGLQKTLLEVSIVTITLLLAGNIFYSTVLGVFLCIAFEGPCLKFQKYILGQIKSNSRRPLPVPGANYMVESDNQNAKIVLNLGPTNMALIK